jgi:hypothetical protein
VSTTRGRTESGSRTGEGGQTCSGRCRQPSQSQRCLSRVRARPQLKRHLFPLPLHQMLEDRHHRGAQG